MQPTKVGRVMGLPNNIEKGANNDIYGAITTVFLAIKLKTLIAMSAWCLYVLTSAVLAV